MLHGLSLAVDLFSTARTICSMHPPIGMAVLLILITLAAAVILIFAIRMSYLDDRDSRRAPSALPIEETAIRWGEDLVDERHPNGLRDKLWRKGFNLGKMKATSQEEGAEEVMLSPKSLP